MDQELCAAYVDMNRTNDVDAITPVIMIVNDTHEDDGKVGDKEVNLEFSYLSPKICEMDRMTEMFKKTDITLCVLQIVQQEILDAQARLELDESDSSVDNIEVVDIDCANRGKIPQTIERSQSVELDLESYHSVGNTPCLDLECSLKENKPVPNGEGSSESDKVTCILCNSTTASLNAGENSNFGVESNNVEENSAEEGSRNTIGGGGNPGNSGGGGDGSDDGSDDGSNDGDDDDDEKEVDSDDDDEEEADEEEEPELSSSSDENATGNFTVATADDDDDDDDKLINIKYLSEATEVTSLESADSTSQGTHPVRNQRSPVSNIHGGPQFWPSGNTIFGEPDCSRLGYEEFSDYEEDLFEQDDGQNTVIDDDDDGDEMEERESSSSEELCVNPPDMDIFGDMAADMKHHPCLSMVCVGGVSGTMYLGKYTLERSGVVKKNVIHRAPIRALEFSTDGDKVISVSRDKCLKISDVITCGPVSSYKNIHENIPSEVRVLSEHLVATGDENGDVKLWDLRQKQSIHDFNVATDFISSIVGDPHAVQIGCTSLDGSVSIVDLKRKSILFQDSYRYELTTSELVRSNTRFVCGTSIGTLQLYSWTDFEIPRETFNVNLKERCPIEINKIVKIKEDILIIALEDGKIRAVQLYPNKQLGIIGQHTVSIDVLTVSADENFVLSCAHEEPVKLWHISYLHENLRTFAQNSEGGGSQDNNLPSSSYQNPQDFFAGLQ